MGDRLIWHEMMIHTTTEAQEAVANILNEEGPGGVVIEDPLDLNRQRQQKFGEIYELDPTKYPEKGVFIKAYFPDNDLWDEKQALITAKINGLHQFGIDTGIHEITYRTVKETDWENEWKKYFKPAKVTEKIVIVPSWEPYEQTEEEMIITLDPGMAFGTGTHPTTMLSLQALERYVQTDDVVLDVGAGSGILSIAAAKLGAAHVYAYDLDDIAVKSTISNCDINHLNEKITVKQNDLLKGVTVQANVIVSNILADILLLVMEDAWSNLTEAGYLITSGIIKEKQALVENGLQQSGFEIIEVNHIENWVSIVAKKRSK